MHPTRKGFTLIELLVVIAIIAILIAPARAGRAEGPRGGGTDAVPEQSQADRPGPAQLRRRHQDAIPPSMYIQPKTVFATNNGSWSIHGRILPFVEQDNAFVKVNLESAWDAQLNTGVPHDAHPDLPLPQRRQRPGPHQRRQPVRLSAHLRLQLRHLVRLRPDHRQRRRRRLSPQLQRSATRRSPTA